MPESDPRPEDPAAPLVRTAVRSALALTRRPPTANERLFFQLSFTFYSVAVVGGGIYLLMLLSVSWGPPAPPALPPSRPL